MSHLDILLPFGLPPAEIAVDLSRALKTPALASMITRTNFHRREEFDAFSRALPHESWLARQFGLEENIRKRGSPPVAVAAMRACDLSADSGLWFLLHPVHLHVARDHLVLTNRHQLSLTDQESHRLFDAIKPLFEEMDKPLQYGDPYHWFVRSDHWDDLHTATPDAASGHNIDIWMPQGSAARDWRKLQNEIQMHWHTHPVNEERESRGEKPVNSVWLWGGAAATMDRPSIEYDELLNLPGWMNALGRSSAASVKNGDASSLINAGSARTLAVLDQLIEPALAGDWSEWITRMHGLETGWFAPLFEALKSGKIAEVSLILTHSTDLVEFTSSRYSLRKFWAKPSLSKLIR
jgi:hypothetical protein